MKITRNMYKRFSKGKHFLHNPVESLKKKQKEIKNRLLEFVDKPEILKNSLIMRMHRYNLSLQKTLHTSLKTSIFSEYTFTTMDIENFFESITFSKFLNSVKRYKKIRIPVDLLQDIADYCFSPITGTLLKGFPSSSLIADISVMPLDNILANKYARYARYVDDLIFVTDNSRPVSTNEIKNLLKSFGYRANYRKINEDAYSFLGLNISPCGSFYVPDSYLDDININESQEKVIGNLLWYVNNMQELCIHNFGYAYIQEKKLNLIRTFHKFAVKIPSPRGIIKVLKILEKMGGKFSISIKKIYDNNFCVGIAKGNIYERSSTTKLDSSTYFCNCFNLKHGKPNRTLYEKYVRRAFKESVQKYNYSGRVFFTQYIPKGYRRLK